MGRQKTINGFLEKVFHKYDLFPYQNHPLREITSYLDRSCEDQIVFYYIKKGKEHLKKFYQRLKIAKAKVVIVNGEVEKREREDVCVINAGEFFSSIVQECVDTLYPVPKKRAYIGVTGTNGKSSVISFISQMACSSTIRTLNLGTPGVFLDGQKQGICLHATTPSHIDLRRILYDYRRNFDLCVLEVSSHGLDQGRVRGISFDVGVWTNLTHDHLDYHGDMESYFKAKLRLQDYLKEGRVILIPSTAEELISRLQNRDGFHIVPVAPRNHIPDFCRLKFNLVNTVLAQKALELVYPGITFDPSSLRPLAGRAEIIQYRGKTVAIDYAHGPDALAQTTYAIQEALSKRPILLFGAGGNRDQSKRAIMGQVAQRCASFSYITTDNPRYEDPEDIIADIKRGFSSRRYEVIVDRRTAITRAIENLNEDEVLIVAGKGDEDYIDIKGVKHPFSDRDTVREALGIV